MNPESKTNWERVDALKDEDIRLGMVADPDAAPEGSDDDFMRARPADEVIPEVVAAYRRGRGPQKDPKKVPVSIRLSPEVVEYFRAEGKGWQTRIDEVLRNYVGAHH